MSNHPAMRFTVLGTSAFTLACAQGLIDAGAALGTLVTLTPELMPENSVDIAAFARARGIRLIETPDIDEPATIAALRADAPDYIMSTWPHLMRTVLSVPRDFTIGSHPTALPYNRGRHPLHWLITQGIAQTELSFFRMDEGVDSGPLLLQVPFNIQPADTIGDAVDRMCTAGYAGVRRLFGLLADGTVVESPQDPRQANSWRRKTLHDVTLDLRLPAAAIVDIVRSFAPPYPGARLLLPGGAVRVIRAAIVPTDRSTEELRRIEPGKVLARAARTLTLKTGDAVVALELETDVPAALRTYVHPPTYYID